MSCLLIEYPKCTTCKRAEHWLEEHGISYESRDIKEEKPTKSELVELHKKSGLPLKRFFNVNGILYRDMGLKDKLPNMTEEEQYTLLETNGMLVKRPLLVTEQKVLVGFKEREWEEYFAAAAVCG